MLHRLIEYADAHGISGQEGFSSKRIRFLFQFSSKGEFLSIHDYGRPGEEFSNVPHLQFEGDVPKRQFLVDTINFLALYPSQVENTLANAIAELKKECMRLLDLLGQESDFNEIQAQSGQVISLLADEKYLELRERDLKKEWAKLLKKKGRGETPYIKEFLRKKGVLDAVFSNEEFKRIGKYQFCLRLLEEASEVEPLLGVIATAMDDPVVLEKIHAELKSKTPAPQGMNNATFAVLDGEKLRVFVKEASWHEWWASKHTELTDSLGKEQVRCFLSGEETKPMLTHPKVKGLGGVGGNAETSLVSFDKGSSAFQSYGFSQGENAAVSVESAVKYTSAINYLLSHQHHRLAGTEIVYWYTKDVSGKEDIIQAAFDGWGSFEDDDDTEENPAQQEAASHIDAKKFLQSIAKGERNDLRDVEYCALTLQGNQGRAVAQNWMEGRFVDLAVNIEQWFSNLEITRLSGISSAKPPKMETLITCLLKEKKPKQNYADWVKPVAAYRDAIWRAAVGGQSVPFPENTVRLVLQRIRESMLTDEWGNTIESDGEQVGMRRARLYARIGLIKAFLIRNHNQEVDMEDREKNKNSVYWLGCLFAELANLQRAAHQSDGGENVKSTIVDRFYTTASTCPKLVHGRLIAQSQHHLRKLENKKPSFARSINAKIAALNKKIDFAEVPDLLPLPEQSWFALGYYQQIAKNNADKAEAIAKKKNKTDSTQGEN